MSICKTNSILADIDLSLLKYFFVVSSHGSFSRAARAVGLSQPALSADLQRLEKTLGVKLVDRGAEEFSLTAEGHTLFAFCRRLEGGLEAVVAELGVKELETKRRLRIGTVFSIGYQPLAGICTKIANTKESIELELTAQGSHQLLSDLVSGTLDAAIFSDDINDARITLRTLGEGQITAVTSPGLNVKFEKFSNWREGLMSLPLIAYPQETPMRYLVDRICTRERLEYKTIISVNGVEALKAMAQNGVGVAFLLRSLVVGDLRSKTLSEMKIPVSLPKVGIVLATRKGETGDEIADLIQDLMSPVGASRKREFAHARVSL